MTYSSEVLADSPLGYWRMGDASGTTMTDSSGNGRHGSYQNGVVLGAAGLVPSSADPAASFASTAFGVVTDDNSMENLTAFTAEAWIKATDLTGSPMIVARDGTTAAGRSFMFYVTSSKLTFAKLANGIVTATSSATLVVGTAYHVAATYDAANIRLYINGSLDSTTAATGSLGSSAVDLRIGARQNNTTGATVNFFQGILDEVAVYDTTLSPTRIAAHYSAGTTSTISGTLSGVLPSLSANLVGTSGPAPIAGGLAGALPPLAADMSGMSELPPATGSISAALPSLSADLAGETYPPGIAGDIAATLPELSAALAGTSTAPVFTGILAATLPALRANLAGQAFGTGTEGYLEAVLPTLAAAFSGDVLGRAGLGLALDSSAVLTVDAVLEPEPSVPAGTPPTVLHIIAPTAPVPTLVAGRPQ